MEDALKITTAESTADAGPDDDLPTGNHALEVAARSGFGPLSVQAKSIWHGHGVPCVTCGQLIRRGAVGCEHCGQDLREGMIERMRVHAGPWFVLEHLRPFPGVSLDRIVRQIRRGLITETSIIRGPASDFQWRFAVETPGLCRYFGKCWHCYHAVQASDSYCASCLSPLSFERPRTTSTTLEPIAPARASAAPQPSRLSAPRSAPPAPSRGHLPAELERLASAVRSFDGSPTTPEEGGSSRLGPIRTTWVAIAAIVVTVAALLAVISVRSTRPAPGGSSAETLTPVSPPAP